MVYLFLFEILRSFSYAPIIIHLNISFSLYRTVNGKEERALLIYKGIAKLRIQRRNNEKRSSKINDV